MSLKARSILVVVVGTVLGLTVSLGGGMLDRHEAASATGSLPISEEDVRRLAEVLQRVRLEYVEQVDDERLIEAAIRGMLSELDDHSRYLGPEEYEEIRISTTGNYSGVGLDVSVKDGKLTVVAPLEGAPAEQAGILPGDVVISVDNVPVDKENVAETVSRMRGRPGTKVTLDVLREGAREPLRFALTRADIQVKTVTSQMLGDGYGYLKVSGFSDRTLGDLEAEVKSLRAAAGPSLSGVVLDLRSNPGGVLDAAVEVADAFLDRGLIVRGRGRSNEARFERHAKPGDLLEGAPLAVLVNAGSASASEIVAGALKDHHRARLVGERTYGKGSVQTVMPLGEGGAIKLTTSEYFTPSGQSINRRGIHPDVVVRNPDPSRRYQGPGSRVSAVEDRQLQEALRVLGHTGPDIHEAA